MATDHSSTAGFGSYRKSPNVTQILEYKSRDTVQALTELLARAQNGQIRSLVFAYKSDSRSDHRIGITGDYWADPAQILVCAARLSYRVNRIIEARAMDYDEDQGAAA